jgi:glycine/D-amino acid oxidase-like deaminating enzyme
VPRDVERSVDLKSGYPFWAIRNGLMAAAPPLRRDLRADVLVVGAGISGALVADELSRHGHAVAVVEQRDLGWGSTAASTALVQYEIDASLGALARRHGEDAAVQAYRACVDGVGRFGEIARGVGDVDYAAQDSLYVASLPAHRGALRAEFARRQSHGFDVEWLDSAALRRTYDLRRPAAILNRPAARVDPYRMAHRLLARARRRGVQVFDRTQVVSIAPTPRGVTLRTDGGQLLRCRHLVMAAGYAAQQWLPGRVAANRSSYAYVTDPLTRAQLGPWADTLLWETARPYLYLRATGEGRLLVGGADDDVDVPALRDRRVERKARLLERKLARLLPRVPATPTFSWGGTFAETPDGLPYFGAHPAHGERVHFAMAFGGNGITYSVLGAAILRAAIEGRAHPLAALFAFDRLA